MLTSRAILLILVSVALSALAQVAFKTGMMQPAVQAALPSLADDWRGYLAIARNFYVLFGLACYAASAALWLLVLARVNLSVAYPFVGLGFILTMAAGAFLFREPVTGMRIAGTLLVCAGVILVGRSA